MDGSDSAPGYAVRAPRAEDAEAVHALIVAADIAEFGEPQGYTRDELEGDWRELDLGRDAWVAVAPDGSLAGYAYVGDRRHVRMDVEGYVHPDHTGRGIGRRLVRLAEARAREHVPLAPAGARVVVNNWVSARNAAVDALLRDEGYAPARFFFRMEMALADPPPAADWPAGLAVRPSVGQGDLAAFYATVGEAMRDHWGNVEVPFDEWVRRRTKTNYDPSLWFLALEGGEPAGVALCSQADGIGWVDTLAVRRPWRKRGLGLALLHHAFGEFVRRGLGRAVLGVDAASPTGATRLYERAGMHVGQEYAAYGKELRPGVELADGDEDGA